MEDYTKRVKARFDFMAELVKVADQDEMDEETIEKLFTLGAEVLRDICQISDAYVLGWIPKKDIFVKKYKWEE